MKKQLHQLRRFFSRTSAKKLNAMAAREAIPASYDDDDGSNRLSGAFIVVLLLHVVALAGVFAFSKIKDRNPAAASNLPDAAQPPKTTAAKTAATNLAAANLAPTQPARGAQENPVAIETPRRIQSSPGAGSAAQPQIKIGQEPFTAAAPAAKLSPAAKPEIKPPPATKTAPSTYVVQKNDTLTKIAKQLGVKYEDLIKLNNIKDPKKLQLGQVLKVPKRV